MLNLMTTAFGQINEPHVETVDINGNYSSDHSGEHDSDQEELAKGSSHDGIEIDEISANERANLSSKIFLRMSPVMKMTLMIKLMFVRSEINIFKMTKIF
jgi:hypothetical protein